MLNAGSDSLSLLEFCDAVDKFRENHERCRVGVQFWVEDVVGSGAEMLMGRCFGCSVWTAVI